MTLIKHLREVREGDLDVGGKATGLARVMGVGDVPVPPGFVLTVEAYTTFVESAALASRVATILNGLDVDDQRALQQAETDLQALIIGAEIPESVMEAIAGAYAQLGLETGRQDPAVAVRSSATGEDSSESSFAGEYETYLWIEGPANVGLAVRRCWASLFGAQAISYRAKRGIRHESAVMAVTIQQMIPAAAAGVMFTLNPQTGDRTVIAIEGSWGLGSIVVDGETNPDLYLVDKVGMRISAQQIHDKPVRCVPAPGGETVKDPVPAELVSAPCLQPEQILELAAIGKRLESSLGGPLDIEWAVDDAGGVFVVQCRPETVWSSRAAAARAALGSKGQGGLMDFVLQSLGPPPVDR